MTLFNKIFILSTFFFVKSTEQEQIISSKEILTGQLICHIVILGLFSKSRQPLKKLYLYLFNGKKRRAFSYHPILIYVDNLLLDYSEK